MVVFTHIVGPPQIHHMYVFLFPVMHDLICVITHGNICMCKVHTKETSKG
jgi:hypothetical protein